jgi:nitrite reductase/ring-hydroxylating ferredoxin subunit
MEDHIVATEDELDEGDRIVVQIKGRDVGVFNVDGEYYAYTSWCAHQGGPACEGRITGTMEAEVDPETRTVEKTWGREGEIIMCPWHGWEFDITTGKARTREDVKLPECPVRAEDGSIIVSL